MCPKFIKWIHFVLKRVWNVQNRFLNSQSGLENNATWGNIQNLKEVQKKANAERDQYFIFVSEFRVRYQKVFFITLLDYSLF